MMISIGELGKKTGVKVPTIRYYEEIGILEPPVRSSGNQRRYTVEHTKRLMFIRHARELGLSLAAIRELVELSLHPQQPCEKANEIAKNHLAAIERRLTQLRRLKRELSRIAKGCEGGTVGECYVIEALSDHRLCQAEHK